MAKIDDKIQDKQIRILHKEITKLSIRRRSLQITDADVRNQLTVFYGSFSTKLLDNTDLSTNNTFADAYNRHVVIDVLTLNTPGSIEVSGNIIDKKTGLIISGNEIFKISKVGRFMTNKHYIGEVTVTGLEGIATTIDAYAADFMNFDRSNFTIKDIHFSFMPDRNNYNIQLNIYKVDKDGHVTRAFIKNFASNDTHKFADNGKIGSFKEAINIEFEGTKNEGFYIVFSEKDDTEDDMKNISTVSLFMNIEQQS